MTKVMTSDTHPIRVDWLPQASLPGQLGMTFAPGKHASSKYGTGMWKRDLQKDLAHLVGHHRVDVLVCLVEDHELARLNIPDLVGEATKHGIEVLRLPIPDAGVLPDPQPARALVAQLDALLSAGKRVVVHCAGGLGRTGTIAGCWLVQRGQSPEAAISLLHETRGSQHCPETPGQERFIAASVAWRSGPERPILAGTRADSFAGAVLGGAIGDAMGAPVEFMSLEEIKRTYGPKGVTNLSGPGARYTDDTQMAEAVLRSLLESRAAGEELDAAMTRMAGHFVEWSRHPQGGHRAPGNACLAGCAALARGVKWSEAGGAQAGGCGSVMRAWPFGLLFADDEARAEQWAVAHSKLTHRDPIALAACASVAVGMARIVQGQPIEFVTQGMVEAARRHNEKTATMVERAILEARAGLEPHVVLDRLRSWAAHEAIAAAAYLLVRNPDDATKAILEGANSPGDSDSIASIAGALVGARVGLARLPRNWIGDLERGNELTDLAVGAAKTA